MMQRVWIWNGNSWHLGVGFRDGGHWTVKARDMLQFTKCAHNRVYPLKYKGRKLKTRSEVIPIYQKSGTRSLPFRLPVVVVRNCAFSAPGAFGDFNAMCQNIEYASCLCIYNENFRQFMDAKDTRPGQGNGVARKYRLTGRSIGIPTGHDGKGFQSLNETIVVNGIAVSTAKAAIDDAIERIVDHVIKQPQYTTIFYSTNTSAETLIGMGVFQIGLIVRNYITDAILRLPQHICKKVYVIRQQQRKRV